jgi:ubiquinone/menaquinone biosynthesis C-methylase UbiE
MSIDGYYNRLLSKWRLRFYTSESDFSNMMSSEWNKRAKENAFRFIDSKKDSWNREEFFETSKDLLTEVKQLLPEGVNFEGSILDVGCGVGRMSVEFAKKASWVFGVDVSDIMIKKAKEYSNEFGVTNVDFYATDGLKYPMIENDSIDLIYCVRVMQHVPVLEVIQSNLSECSRVLKRKGYLIFMTQDSFNPDGINPTYNGVRCGRKEIVRLTANLPLEIINYGKDGVTAYFTIMRKSE